MTTEILGNKFVLTLASQNPQIESPGLAPAKVATESELLLNRAGAQYFDTL
jgi:hypothetical protein